MCAHTPQGRARLAQQGMGSWFSFLLLALLMVPLPSAEQSLVGAVWLAETLGPAAGGLWVGADLQRGLALSLFLGEDGEWAQQPHCCSFAAAEDLAWVTGRNTKHS